jgi:plastocyanin
MNRRTIFSALGLPALAALTFAVAACGGGGGSSTPAPTVPAGALQVTAGPGLVLDKGEYTIAATAGQVTIAYVQRDTQRHTLVVKDASGVIQGTKLEVIKNGDVSVGTFALAPGTYTMNCDVPGHGPMKAKLIVT